MKNGAEDLANLFKKGVNDLDFLTESKYLYYNFYAIVFIL